MSLYVLFVKCKSVLYIKKDIRSTESRLEIFKESKLNHYKIFLKITKETERKHGKLSMALSVTVTLVLSLLKILLKKLQIISSSTLYLQGKTPQRRIKSKTRTCKLFLKAFNKTLLIPPIMPKEMEDFINTLDTNKRIGPNNIPTSIQKKRLKSLYLSSCLC